MFSAQFQHINSVIHNMHIRCKGNKFISFVDKKAWKSFLKLVYKCVDIHDVTAEAMGHVDKVHFIIFVFHKLINSILWICP